MTGQFRFRCGSYKTLVFLITRSHQSIDSDVLLVSLPRPTLLNKQSGGARCILKITCDITEPLSM